MLPPASDGHQTPPLRSNDDDPDRPPAKGEPDVLSGLVRMVTERATRLRGATAADPRGMDGLREAVDALEHYLDALELLRGSGIAIDEPPVHPDPRPAPNATPPPEPEPRADSDPPPAPLEPRSGPASDDVIERRSEPPPQPPVHPLRAGPRLAREPAAARDPEAPVAGGSASGDGAIPSPAPSGGGTENPEPADGERTFPAFRDASSGLLSREGFEWIASGELKRCARHGRVFSILLLQLDTDDAATLRRTAEVVRRVLRGSDVAGREGERAVVVALPETAPREARAVGERLIEHLAGSGGWSREGRIGMAAYPTHGETVWSLLETARGKLSLPVGNVLQRGGDGGYWSG